jgi:hypothetical protein
MVKVIGNVIFYTIITITLAAAAVIGSAIGTYLAQLTFSI